MFLDIFRLKVNILIKFWDLIRDQRSFRFWEKVDHGTRKFE